MSRRMLGIRDNAAAIPGEGDLLMPRQHSNIMARPALLVSLLLAIILPASLLACTYATADNTANESSATHTVAPTTQANSGEEVDREAQQQSSNSLDITTQPTATATIPTSPSPLATSSPLNPKQPTPSIASTLDKDDAKLQARASTPHTVTFSSPQGTNTTQTVVDGERVKRPADPTRNGYLFDGWFTGSTPVAYDFSQPVTGDLKLTAHWTRADVWSMSPVQGPVAGGTKVTLTPPGSRGVRFSQVSSGRGHTLAIASDGNLYSWGSNDHGQLGDRTTTERHEPVPVKKPQGVSQDFTWVQASAGYLFSVALGSDGKLYSWGDNTYGQLGNNTTTEHHTPEPVNMPQNAPSGFTWKQEAVGSLHALGLGSDGNLYSWGSNDHNQLGDGTATERHAPVLVKMPKGASSGFIWKQMSGWGWHSLALGSDNWIYGWGANTRGEVGTGSITDNKITPVPIAWPQGAPSGFTWGQFQMGDYYSQAIGSDGNIYTWGYGGRGNVGNGLTADVYGPTRAHTPNGVLPNFSWKQVSLLSVASLAIGSDGNLYSWGANDNGQLGDNTTTQRNTPVKVAAPPDTPTGLTWVQASAGWDNNSFGLASDGNLYSWGKNANGQLGDNTTSERHVPGRVNLPGTTTVTAVSFGGTAGTNIAKNADGTWSVTTPAHARGKVDTTVSWTLNGQQPDAHLAYRYLDSYTVTFTSADSSCPAPSGMPQNQTLAESKQAKRPSPDPKANGCLFDGWFIKDAGNDSKIAYDFSQPVTGNITLAAHWTKMDNHWALNPEKGNVLGGQHVTITPPTINRGIRFNQISAGGYQTASANSFSIGISSDGNAYAWGSNKYGQLTQKPADASMQKAPVRVPLPDGVDSSFTYTQVAAGDSHVLAIGSNGILYSWGRNDHGQLGDGTTTDRYQPQPVKDTSGQPFKAVQVSAGVADSAAIDSESRVYTWGSESTGKGQAPIYSTTRKNPAPAADPDNPGQTLRAVQVSLNWSFVMALDADGNVYTWGYNTNGQLGNNTSNSTNYASNPARLPNQSFQATQISAGSWNALAIDSNGNTWTWGYNGYGQLGDGSTSDKYRPQTVQNPTNTSQSLKATQISAGVNHSLAVGQDGNLWAWGLNSNGQLGIGSTVNQTKPTLIKDPANKAQAFKAVRSSAGQLHSLAIRQDGNLWAWGGNQYGQLGNNQTATKSTTPLAVAFDPTPLVLTGVEFGGIPGTSLYRNDDGTWSITNPPHDAGHVDVAVDWTIDQVAQTTAHLGYTYEGILPMAGSTGLLVLLATGLLAAAGATAAASHQRETSSRRH